MSQKKQDEFAGFVTNPQARQRGGAAIQAARGQQRRGLLERLAQVETQRLWRAEIAARVGQQTLLPLEQSVPA